MIKAPVFSALAFNIFTDRITQKIGEPCLSATNAYYKKSFDILFRRSFLKSNSPIRSRIRTFSSFPLIDWVESGPKTTKRHHNTSGKGLDSPVRAP
ncbi:MAG: hypothetical protein A2021_08005 [Elusimicrobia bacterium GWF2_52_66]|nr:MAG: hypothetical protein A2X33_05805 [Elusimicrobia bacterium GWA2_51_34]OGR85464.1 MAG: hypothetical protein A2021_08005 [Elusimicrobia bacterium GWF2_52_66]HAF94506.1 hypothetical protein [Elusimicrobiota bacterium]HCE99143.1 hypothetical protein [Elusimicrobiota bacterium]